MKKSLNLFFVLIVSGITACSNGEQNRGKGIPIDSAKIANETALKNTPSNNDPNAENEQALYCRKEKLSGTEKLFLNRLKKENTSIIYFDDINRFYSKKDNKLAFSKLMIPADSLISEGYVYYDFTFFGDLSDLSILYKFNQGAALFGEGSVIGEDTASYFHTVVTFTTGGDGTTGKNVDVYSNGQRLCTKEYPLDK